MALARLWEDGGDTGRRRFRFDIGKNRYFTFAIGDGTSERSHGIAILRDPVVRSPLEGPLPPQLMGRGFFDIDEEKFDRDNQHLQLISYRTETLEGPAISDILRIGQGLPGRHELAKPGFVRERAMEMTAPPVETRRFIYREVPRGLSGAMFLGALTSILPNIVNVAGPLLGKLFGGGGGGAKAGGGSPLAALGNPQTIEMITKLLQSLAGGGAGAAPTAQSLGKRARLQDIGRQRDRIYPAAFAREPFPMALQSYSEAQIAPALMAALPMLMPLLQQVLTPETIKGLLDAPNKATQTVINGVTDVIKLGLESDKQDMEHLRKLNPGVEDARLDSLLESMSVGLSRRQMELSYRRTDAVTLNFADVHTQEVFGQTKVLYRFGQTLGFPVIVETPRPIPDALLQILVKDAETLEALCEERMRIDRVVDGKLDRTPTLPEAKIRTLRPDRDYLVGITLVWKNRAGKRRGTSRQQRVSLVSDFVFDRVEESGPLIPLRDVDRFRDYWHKIWQGAMGEGVRGVEFDCKYYFALNAERENNGRLETKTRIEESDRNTRSRRRRGKLKSGMELSPRALNRLLSQISPGSEPLSAGQIAALATGDFADRFNQAGRYHAKLRGRQGDSVALWVYPEVKLQTVILEKIAEVNSHGNVVNMTEVPVRLPMPAAIHFIGTRTA